MSDRVVRIFDEEPDQAERVVPLFGTSDPRYNELLNALLEVIHDRKGLLFVGVLGVLRLIEDELIRDQRE